MRQIKRSDYLSELEKLCQAYQIVFDQKSPYVQLVIKDLVKFCKARESEYVRDSRDHAYSSGARAVWLRIEQFTMDQPETILERTAREIPQPLLKPTERTE